MLFIEQVRGDDPELATYLRIEERELARRTRGVDNRRRCEACFAS